jgi:hypothetical protein
MAQQTLPALVFASYCTRSPRLRISQKSFLLRHQLICELKPKQTLHLKAPGWSRSNAISSFPRSSISGPTSPASNKGSDHIVFCQTEQFAKVEIHLHSVHANSTCSSHHCNLIASRWPIATQQPLLSKHVSQGFCPSPRAGPL